MKIRLYSCVTWLGLALSAACASAGPEVELAESQEALTLVQPKTNPKVVTCGGFVGTACPGVGECVDDPRDDCDPLNGGADCGGVCSCTQTVPCGRGRAFNKSPAVCDCQPVSVGPIDNRCAVTTCPAGTKCRIIEGEVACVPTGIVLP